MLLAEHYFRSALLLSHIRQQPKYNSLSLMYAKYWPARAYASILCSIICNPLRLIRHAHYYGILRRLG